MPNYGAIPKNEEHPVSTPTGGRATNYPGVTGASTADSRQGLAEIRTQVDTGGDMGPKFRSVLDKSEEMSTGHDLAR